jgi:hypothetical protein
MNELVYMVRDTIGVHKKIRFRLPYVIAYIIAKVFDFVASISGKKFSISSIRVKKFHINSVYDSKLYQGEFVPPIPLNEALVKTVRHEFVDFHN